MLPGLPWMPRPLELEAEAVAARRIAAEAASVHRSVVDFII